MLVNGRVQPENQATTLSPPFQSFLPRSLVAHASFFHSVRRGSTTVVLVLSVIPDAGCRRNVNHQPPDNSVIRAQCLPFPSLPLSLSTLRDCQRAARLFPCFSPPKDASCTRPQKDTNLRPNVTRSISSLLSPQRTGSHCAPALSLLPVRCPFTVCRRRVPRECCTARLAGRQPSIKLMYELQTRDVCPMGPVYPLFLHQPTPFRAAPFFFSSEGQPPRVPLSFASSNVSDISRLGSNLSFERILDVFEYEG